MNFHSIFPFFKRLWIAITCLLIIVPPTLGGGYGQVSNNQLIIREKVVQFGDSFKIIGIPVSETKAEYYYQRKQSTGQFTDDDAKKIASYVVDELLRRSGNIPQNPQNPSNPPNPEQPNEGVSLIEKQTLPLINGRCGTCHSGDTAAGGLSFIKDDKLKLEDLKGVLSEDSIAWMMFSATLDESMPKNGNKLTNEEINLLHDLAKHFTKRKRN